MIDPNQPAFPELHIHHFLTDAEGKEKPAVVPRWGGGLTKREYFAGMAMQGIISALRGTLTDQIEDIAKSACAVSDAIIAELNK